jgi:hypothetical protein
MGLIGRHLGWLAVAGWLCPLAAWAVSAPLERTGVVIRVQSMEGGLQPPVIARLRDDLGGTLDVEVADGGQVPDVAAGDGLYTGADFVVGHNFILSLSAGGEDLGRAVVGWPEGVESMDIEVVVKGGGLLALAKQPIPIDMSQGHQNVGPAHGSPPGPTPPEGPELLEGELGLKQTPGGEGVVRVSYPAKAGSEPWVWLILLGGCLAAFGFLYLVFLSQGEDESIDPRLEPLPEAGFLGEGTSGLGSGTSLWAVSPEEWEAALLVLLQTVARSHAILLVMPPGEVAPPVRGGPTYRAPTGGPGAIAKHAHRLHHRHGGRLVVLVTDASDRALLANLAELMPKGVGVLGLVAAGSVPSSEPVTHLSREGDGWRVDGRPHRMGMLGLEPVTPAGGAQSAGSESRAITPATAEG